MDSLHMKITAEFPAIDGAPDDDAFCPECGQLMVRETDHHLCGGCLCVVTVEEVSP